MSKIFEVIYNSLENNNPVILMIVLKSEGSSPGREGFKMVVSSNGELFGSIGGGIMEYNLVEAARNKLREAEYSIELIEQLHDNGLDTDRSGMICSGSQTLAIIPFSSKDIDLICSIHESLKDSKESVLRVTQSGINLIIDKRNKQNFTFTFNNEKVWQYEENLFQQNIIYIIGGGHVGLALSKIMSFLNFYIVVLDDRSEIDTMKKNVFANEKIVISYDKIEDYIKEGDNNYLVIMTHGHKADELVLRKMLNKKVKYIGMMGSPEKVKYIFNNLLNDRIPVEKIKNIHSPIGIPIKSHTPEEIAISITAEIIKIKNAN
jgi:xanthine dehydrogenase accessory factor